MLQDHVEFQTKLFGYLERIASAFEKIADFEVDRAVNELSEVDPPHCPHCHKINPSITREGDESGSGLFGHFFLTARCDECNERFFAVPDWKVYMTQDDAIEILKNKVGQYEPV